MASSLLVQLTTNHIVVICLNLNIKFTESADEKDPPGGDSGDRRRITINPLTSPPTPHATFYLLRMFSECECYVPCKSNCGS